ncbi:MULTISPECIES: phosphoglycerate dehydrogenase [Protofrankia]|uniref:D-3-phosphoglycerate dehydrogenase n=2 Tax=Candidatus Protofrankia datiscae TaxID=2716812 RepID=F8B514_9ACTN|nr:MULTISPECIES: phosphoglycerate dehydrogenase [Protofrankia]AEH11036.1 D-3-phosphoglycerate dehydrogenase [Candidatus Protofrankia datiscae]
MPVVLVAEELSPAGLELLSGEFEVRHLDGTDRAALLGAIPEADALIVRSATRVDAEVLAAARSLKVVARAGIGLDNVDVVTATTRGVMVVNAPLSNIVSAAEHAVALLAAVARRIPAANAALRGGEWKRSKYVGVELADKTAGVVGLGRIGLLVAQRLAAFGMKIVAYDPYVSVGRAAQLGVRLVDLDELLRISDVITIHLPKTPETIGLIGRDELERVRPGVIIINDARGGLVDEEALADAVRDGRVGGAGIDVFATEPTTSSPLFELDNVVVTPHLGASTAEAQEKAGVAVARSVRLALRGEFVPDAVNVQAGGVVAEDVRPGLPLAEKLGQLFTGLAGGLAAAITVEVRGEIVAHDVSVLQLAALKGVFTDVIEEPVTYVNAPLLAKDRGVDVALETFEESPDYRNLVTVRGVLADGTPVSVSGTLTGPRQVEKVTAIDDFEVDIRPQAHLAFFRYEDRPGVVGAVGALLGEAQINIAGAQVSRRKAGGEALMSLSLDDTVPVDVLTEIAKIIGASAARSVSLHSQ